MLAMPAMTRERIDAYPAHPCDLCKHKGEASRASHVCQSVDPMIKL
jgi:hypothetical protein